MFTTYNNSLLKTYTAYCTARVASMYFEAQYMVKKSYIVNVFNTDQEDKRQSKHGKIETKTTVRLLLDRNVTLFEKLFSHQTLRQVGHVSINIMLSSST